MSEWQFYLDALAGKRPEAHEGDIHTGYYRTRRFDPVAIWFHEGKPVALKAGKPVGDANDIADLFLQVAGFPIEHALYLDVMAGKGWPHERILPASGFAAATAEVVKTAVAQPAPRRKTDPSASTNVLPAELAEQIEKPSDEIVPSIGHNQPPDEFTLLKEDIAAKAETARALPDPKNQIQADAYADLVKSLQELQNEADARYEKEMRPHNRALQVLREKYFPLSNQAEAAKKLVKTKIAGFLTAEKARREANAAKTEGVTAEPVKAGTRGTVAMREFRRAQITDYAMALAYFAESEEVRAVVQSLANALAASKARIAAPGCEIITEQRAA